MIINWTENVEVRQHNGQCEHGSWMDADDVDVPGWVRDMVADEIAEDDADDGRVEQGGSIWVWRKRTDDAETVEVRVRRYVTGEPVGTIEMASANWERYANQADERFQWPEGIAEAGRVLMNVTLERLDLDTNTVIYLD